MAGVIGVRGGSHRLGRDGGLDPVPGVLAVAPDPHDRGRAGGRGLILRRSGPRGVGRSQPGDHRSSSSRSSRRISLSVAPGGAGGGTEGPRGYREPGGHGLRNQSIDRVRSITRSIRRRLAGRPLVHGDMLHDQTDRAGKPACWYAGSMKVTIDLDADLYRSLKVEAARADRSVREVMADALSQWLERARTRRIGRQRPKPWPNTSATAERRRPTTSRSWRPRRRRSTGRTVERRPAEAAPALPRRPLPRRRAPTRQAAARRRRTSSRAHPRPRDRSSAARRDAARRKRLVAPQDRRPPDRLRDRRSDALGRRPSGRPAKREHISALGDA